MNCACANASASRPRRVTTWWSGRANMGDSRGWPVRRARRANLSKWGPGLRLAGLRDPGMIGETTQPPVPEQAEQSVPESTPAPEFGGREGPDPTRYGDWEKNGRCIDF
ncbi:DUF1674 domain-containing protein [Luteimonas sp. 22616]|uniref:DUF1674 domain-containing protein n=1 Tax=Luteimonas sp. 22616 TaxID=3453951 RepID=UPI003F86BA0B